MKAVQSPKINMTDAPVINGVIQYLIIRGENPKNPVLLYLHGGPGASDFCLVKDVMEPLEKLFTICYWEQRGAGKSYSTLQDQETLSLRQLILDTETVTKYLLLKYNQSKLFILGHSWGSFLAVHAVRSYAHLYYAYLGIGQVTDQLQSEIESYQFVKMQALLRKKKRLLATLGKLILPDKNAPAKQWANYLNFQRPYVMAFGGTLFKKNAVYAVVKSLACCEIYTTRDKINYLKSGRLGLLKLWPSILNTNVIEKFAKLDIPVYLFHGAQDKHTSYVSALKYFEVLDAPVKEFYTFMDAAHFPHLECFAQFEEIIRGSILQDNDDNY
jgi:pimeloyl-ACP methyl ester carboxylesterase